MENFDNTINLNLINRLIILDKISVLKKEDYLRKFQNENNFNFFGQSDFDKKNNKILIYFDFKNPKIKYFEEEYSENNELIYRTFYNKLEINDEELYSEIFKSDDLPLNYGFVSRITNNDISNINLNIPISINNALGFRYYQNKFEHENGNYFTIIKNPNYREDKDKNINEQKYIIADNCGGKSSGEECKNLMINLLKNQFKNKMGFEISGNNFLSVAFITSLQEEFKNHNSIKLYNINLGNQYNRFPIIDFKNINLSKDKISIIPILTDGHAVVLLYNPSDKKFHLFDSSGAFIKYKDRMKKIFGDNYKDFLNTESLNMNSIQINGSCSFWSNTFIKKLLEDNKGKKYNRFFFKENIIDKFENCSMQLELCSDITRLFDNKEFIKIFNKKKDIIKTKFIIINTINENIKDKYYIFKTDNKYYGIDKEFYNNRFFNINNLTRMKEIEKIEFTSYKLNSEDDKKKLINELENRKIIQNKIIEIQNKFNKIENRINILKINQKLKIIQRIDENIKNIMAKKEENDKSKNEIEILIEKIELLSKKSNDTTEILNEADIKLINKISGLKSILGIEEPEKLDTSKNSKIIKYLENSNLELKENLIKISDFREKIEEINKTQDAEKNLKNYVNRYKEQEESLNQNFNENYEIILESMKKIYENIEEDVKFNEIDELVEDIKSNYPNLIKEDLMEMEDLIKKINDFNKRDKETKKKCKNIEESIESYDKIITELNSDFNTKNILEI